MRVALSICTTAAAILLTTGMSVAQDRLKIAIGQINNWENQASTLGVEAGVFDKHHVKLDSFGTSGSGETMQAVISGSTDLGVGVGVAAALRAFMSGAPVRILLPAFTGTGDLYWYVRSDSPIRTLDDANRSNSIAYSTNGSTSHNLVLAFRRELGAKARPVATGSPTATLVAVMTHQIDIGWSAPPFGLRERKDGKIRIVARGSDVASLNRQTVRSIIVNADSYKRKRDAILGFVKGYREAVDWMYSDPTASEAYARKTGLDLDLLRSSVAQFHPKSALQTTSIENLPGIIRDALALKIISTTPTPEQLNEFIQVPR